MNYDNCLKFANVFGKKMKIYLYVKNVLNKKLIQDKIIAGRHQEVLRKLKFSCIDRHNISRNIFYKYGLTDNEINLMTHK